MEEEALDLNGHKKNITINHFANYVLVPATDALQECIILT